MDHSSNRFSKNANITSYKLYKPVDCRTVQETKMFLMEHEIVDAEIGKGIKVED
jgi:hypothetical protein